MPGKENRPGVGNTGAALRNLDATNVYAEILRDRAECNAASDAFTNAYAVLVQGRTDRRHVYLNLPAAVRAVERAEARGDRAGLLLVRLVPVEGEVIA